jgi:RNA 2',3'-cyclic 3'-phosphodiesterase
VRLFIAVWPPADLLDALAALPRPERPGVRWTTRDQGHVTLRFLGEVPEAEPVVDALRAGLAGVPAGEVVLGPAAEALSRHIVAVPVAGLEAVGSAVIAATAPFGKPPEGRPFHGHITLARVKRGSARALGGAPLDGRWTVREVDLVRSTLHPHGARYDTVATIPLQGA